MKASLIKFDQEKILWQKGLLFIIGDHSPLVILWYVWWGCILNSGVVMIIEGETLYPWRIQLVEPLSGTAYMYLHYKQDISAHHTNKSNIPNCVPKQLASKCLLFCTSRKDYWYKPVTIGHNKLAEVAPSILKGTLPIMNISCNKNVWCLTIRGHYYEQEGTSFSRW